MSSAGGSSDSPSAGAFGLSGELDAALVHALFQNAVDSIIITNSRGVIESVNPAVTRLFGYLREELVGQNVKILMPSPDREAHDGYLDNYHRTGQAKIIGVGREIVAQRKDGSLFPGYLSISEMRLGNEVKFAGIIHDITSRKLYEESLRQRAVELREAKEQAEAASRAKDQFLAVLSHELRTPLTPALAMLSMLETEPEVPAESRSAVAMVRRNIELEARLIDDLLDLTRVSRGKLQLHLESIDAHAAICDTVEICKQDILARSLEVDCCLRATQPFVLADPARFRQVIWNLLKNAIKFTPPGGRISLSTENQSCDLPRAPLVEDIHVDGQCLVVEVRDTGIGIDAEALPRIFAAFEQADPSIMRQFGGLGLGLAISRAVADMHHGRLSAHSEGRGHGAMFRFELHTVQPITERKEAAAPVQSSARQLRILLVDDHPDTVRVMQLLLRRMGHEATTAITVAGARQSILSGQYDLLISDIGLPDGTGLELMQWALGQGVPAGIALSGYGMDEDLRRSREAGFSEHITKPIDLTVLRSAIDRVARESATAKST